MRRRGCRRSLKLVHGVLVCYRLVCHLEMNGITAVVRILNGSAEKFSQEEESTHVALTGLGLDFEKWMSFGKVERVALQTDFA
jgi:hypothetical protein